MKKMKMIGAVAVMAAVLAVTAIAGCGKKEASAPAGTTQDGGESPGQTLRGADDTQEASQGAAQAGEPGDGAEFKLLTGDVTSVTDTFSEVTIEVEGVKLTFPMQQASIETSYELAPDTKITVIYKGQIDGGDTSKATAVMVVDVQEGMAVQDVTGEVVEQAMSAFTIRKADGTEQSFLKNNCEGLSEGVLGQAQDDSNGSGVTVKVTYVSVQYENASLMNFPLKVEAV